MTEPNPVSDEPKLFTLSDVYSAALGVFGGGREFGTPLPPEGVFCRLCGAEALSGKPLKHDPSCLLFPYELTATLERTNRST